MFWRWTRAQQVCGRILFDREQNIVASRPGGKFSQIYPRQGWVEHDPMEIYSSQYGVMMEVIAKSEVDVKDIAAIGITNQRETTVLWDKKTRTPDLQRDCLAVPPDGGTSWMRSKRRDSPITYGIRRGLCPTRTFPGRKSNGYSIMWKGARERAERGEILFGTIDSWLTWKLTEGEAHITDYTNASRTMIYDIKTLDWDDRLLRALDIPRKILPEVHDSSEIYGYTMVKGTKIPIAGIAGGPASRAVRADVLFPRPRQKTLMARDAFC